MAGVAVAGLASGPDPLAPDWLVETVGPVSRAVFELLGLGLLGLVPVRAGPVSRATVEAGLLPPPAGPDSALDSGKADLGLFGSEAPDEPASLGRPVSRTATGLPERSEIGTDPASWVAPS